VHRLPTRIVYFTLAGVSAGLIFASVIEWSVEPLATAVLGALLFTNAFFLIWLFTTKYAGMMILGYGDVRLAAVLGLLLGWYGLPFVLYGALAGHLLALAIAVATCIRKRQLHMTYSFGPPLIAGTLAVVLFAA
ncbi:MAG: prepilin peptidase, partial [Acidobacteriota bacterium]